MQIKVKHPLEKKIVIKKSSCGRICKRKNGKYHKIENRNKILHTIGNLTILTNSLTPSVSNSSFDIKKQEIGLQSTVILNTYFQGKPIWDEEQIKKRSQYLYDQIKTTL